MLTGPGAVLSTKETAVSKTMGKTVNTRTDKYEVRSEDWVVEGVLCTGWLKKTLLTK